MICDTQGLFLYQRFIKEHNQEVLNEYLAASAKKIICDYIQPDNAHPMHLPNSTWKGQNKHKIKLLLSPPQSPDLYPLVNLWVEENSFFCVFKSQHSSLIALFYWPW